MLDGRIMTAHVKRQQAERQARNLPMAKDGDHIGWYVLAGLGLGVLLFVMLVTP